MCCACAIPFAVNGICWSFIETFKELITESDPWYETIGCPVKFNPLSIKLRVSVDPVAVSVANLYLALANVLRLSSSILKYPVLSNVFADVLLSVKLSIVFSYTLPAIL